MPIFMSFEKHVRPAGARELLYGKVGMVVDLQNGENECISFITISVFLVHPKRYLES